MGNRCMKPMQDMKRSSAPTAPHSRGAPFIPILPFSTPSDLSALYILGPELGRGQFGIIRSCTSRSSGTLFACKSISKLHLHTACDVEDVVREVRIMKRLSNVHASHWTHFICPSSIVCLCDVIEDEGFVHLLMELCHGGELFNRIREKRCYPEPQAAFLMKSLLETVQFCHSRGIMHRDIKPENLLLVDDSDASPIKLADFGLALEFSPGQKFSGMAGSSYYIAPEVLQGEYSEEIDMWSAGVVLYILLSGVPPFSGATQKHIFHAIQKAELSFPSSSWDSISTSAKDMIAGMLHPDPKSRLTPAQALKHPWIVHHTNNTMHMQLMQSVPSNMQPSSPVFGQQSQSARDLGPCTPPMLSSNSCNQRWSAETLGLADTAKSKLDKVFVDLIAGMNRKTASASDTSGWTCTALSLNGSEETLVVDMGQDRYLVSHDRARKRIGWKLLTKDQPLSSNLLPILHPPINV